MHTYFAFLRGINVGGHKLIKMTELSRMFSAAGMKNVRTFIASGNVIFDSPSANREAVRRKIQKRLVEELGYHVELIIRDLSEIESLVKRNPFKKTNTASDAMLFVVFLAADPKPKPNLPLKSAVESLEVIDIRDGVAFVVARRKKTGRVGFPNNFVEKELGVAATTRNWSTVNKMLAAAKKR